MYNLSHNLELVEGSQYFVEIEIVELHCYSVNESILDQIIDTISKDIKYIVKLVNLLTEGYFNE
jgi:hypothetical protein